jgi:hypothetical protein
LSIAANTRDIAANTLAIADNLAGINKNQRDIKKNEKAIEDNTESIAQNSRDIATNAADIDNVEAVLGVVSDAFKQSFANGNAFLTVIDALVQTSNVAKSNTIAISAINETIPTLAKASDV